MVFFSIAFLIYVLAAAIVYFLVPKNYRWCVLLVASYVFYWLNSRLLVLVLLATTLVTFLIGRWIDSENAKGKAELAAREGLTGKEKKALKEALKRRTRRILVLGIVLDLGTLLFLKYFNFFGENINWLLGLFHAPGVVPVLNLLLPLGISFYTLQAIAYMTDIYRGKGAADKNPFKFMLFMSFFPQIVQGPIARHKQLAGQLYEGHEFDYRRVTFGLQLILWGFFKKLVIADRLIAPVAAIFDNVGKYHGLMVFLGAAMYGLQVYADFSGGMDIARGVAQIFGIDLELNFKQPYFAFSIEDFWRRWHITLGSFMRDYVFYPLSLSKGFANLSRKSRKLLGSFVGKRLPSFLAMFIVYILVGFWHGAEWQFIFYGLYNGFFIMAGILLGGVYNKLREKLGIGANTFTWKLFQILRTFVLVSMGRYFSRADSLYTALRMFKRTFQQIRDVSFLTNGSLLRIGLTNAEWWLLLFAIMLLLFVDYTHEKGIRIRESIARQGLIFRWAIYLGIIVVILVFGVYGPGYSAASFIYEKF